MSTVGTTHRLRTPRRERRGNVVALAQPGAQPSVTLDSLIAALEPLATLVLAPRGLAVEVAGVHVLDRLAREPAPPGGAVLAAGIETSTRDLLELIVAAGRAGAAVVVLKHRSAPPPPVIETAARAGVALLQARTEVPWGDLHALIAACIARWAPHADDGPLADAGGDLYKLTDVTATLTGCAVTIEDGGLRLLAYSRSGAAGDAARTDGILARCTPARLSARLRSGAVARALAAGEVVKIDVEGLRPRRVVAVRAGGVAVGYVWLVEGTQRPDADADAALREAARLAAPLLASQRLTTRVERTACAEWLAQLLDGDGPPAVLAAQLRIPVAAWFTVAAFALKPARDGEREAQGVQVADVATLQLRPSHDDVVAVELDGVLYALLVHVKEPRRGRIHTAVGDCLARLRRTLGSDVRAALGATVVGLDNVAGARTCADRALAVGAQRGASEVVDIEDVRGEAFVLALREHATRTAHPLSRQLAQLCEHDAEHASDYVPTLRTYLDCMGDSVRAAQRLHVHPNTVRYRIRRVGELTGVDLACGDQRFALECQLRLLVP